MIPFTNPSLKSHALWASAVEQYVRRTQPDLVSP